jgi:carbamoylphosphate synthase large subunit
LGSTTKTENIWPKSVKMGISVIELNTVEAINNSRSKLLMKDCFQSAGIPHAKWFEGTYRMNNGTHGLFRGENEASYEYSVTSDEIEFPILAKRVFGFKGKGMVKLNSKKELEDWIKDNNINGYYFEQFHNYSREYRLHCSKNGCFYAVRKMIKEDIPKDMRWFRNDSNCIWVTEYEIERNVSGKVVNYNEHSANETFDKPCNWDKIERDCIKALNSVGLDIGAFDVKVQSATDKRGEKRTDPQYIIIEVNSAPSFGELTTIKYRSEIPKLLNEKFYKLLK